MNIFDLPYKEHPYLPEDEMWLVPGDLFERLDSWHRLGEQEKDSLMIDIAKAIATRRMVVVKNLNQEDK